MNRPPALPGVTLTLRLRMALTPGTRLGPYEAVAPIGKGRMGEVDKAKDTRLDRTVAIKVLQPEFAESEGWKTL